MFSDDGELLGDEVHPVAQRRHHRDVGSSEQSEHHRTVEGVDAQIEHRHVVATQPSGIEGVDDTFEFDAEGPILLECCAAGLCDLDEMNLVGAHVAALERQIVRNDSFEDALGVVESIDADDQRATPGRTGPVVVPGPVSCRSRSGGERIGIDRHGRHDDRRFGT